MLHRFFFLLPLLSAVPAAAQKTRLAGTYVARIRDDIGYDNCCTLTRLLQLRADSSFTYYRLNDQGDYFTEQLYTGRFSTRGNEVRFLSDSTSLIPSPFRHDPEERFGDTLLRLSAGRLRSRGPEQFIGGGSNEVVTWHRVDWQQLDSLEVTYMPHNDTMHAAMELRYARHRHLWYAYYFTYLNRRDANGWAARSDGTCTIPLAAPLEKELVRRLASGPLFGPAADRDDFYTLSIHTGGHAIKVHGTALSPAFARWIFGAFLQDMRSAYPEVPIWGDR